MDLNSIKLEITRTDYRKNDDGNTYRKHSVHSNVEFSEQEVLEALTAYMCATGQIRLEEINDIYISEVKVG